MVTFRLIGNSQVNFAQFSRTTLPAAIQKLQGTLEMGKTSQEHSDIVLTIPSLSNKD
jgi:hypothetical protein